MKWRLRKETELIEPLLILGEGRSGSTLLMQLLATSSQIAFDRIYPFEIRYLTYLLHWASLIGKPCQMEADWTPANVFDPSGARIGPLPYANTQLWDGQELWPRCFRAVWREFSNVTVAQMDVKIKKKRDFGAPVLYYAEKTPFWMPERLRLVMPYKAIILIRDPRDIFLSITAFNKKRGFSAFSRFDHEDDWAFARRFVKLYKQNSRIIRKEEAASHSLLIKYEQLALNLDEETRRLGQWLGVELNAGRVKKQIRHFAHHMTSSSPAQSVERWRHEMAPEMTEFFQKELRKELRHFGYDA